MTYGIYCAIEAHGAVERLNQAIQIDGSSPIAKNKQKSYITKTLGLTVDIIVEHKSPINRNYHAIYNYYLKGLIKSNSITLGKNLNVRVISLTDSGVIA